MVVSRTSMSRVSRRRFLGGVCSAAAALPFLRQFPLQADEPGDVQPKLLLFGAPNGPLVGRDGNGGLGYQGWLPDGVMPPEGALPEVLPDVYEALSPYRDDLLFLENLSFLDDNVHRATNGMLTGRRRFIPPGQAIEQYSAQGISVDHFLADALNTNVLNTAYKIAGFALGESYWSYLGQSQPVTPIQNPVDAYERVFGEGLDTGLAAQVLSRRTSVLDVVAKDIGAMKARVPSADRIRLEHHLDAVRSLEEDLIASAALGCSPTGAPAGYDFLSDAVTPTVNRDHAQVIAQAFACGWGRIATMQIGSFGGELRPRWPELGVDSTYTCHAICHAFDGIDGAGSGGLSQAQGVELGLARERAYSVMFAEVLGQLSNTLDVDGNPILDNTLVAYMRPMGRNHDGNRILWIVAGGSALGVQGGRFVQVGDGAGNKRYYNDFLTAACNVMGHPVDSFGEAQFNDTPISFS